MVIRGIYEEYTKAGKPKRIPADVYYFTPEGTKLVKSKSSLEVIVLCVFVSIAILDIVVETMLFSSIRYRQQRFLLDTQQYSQQS